MPASRFHDGQHGVTHIVRVFAFGRELRIVGLDDATLAVWKPALIQAAPEIDPDGAVTLTSRGQPGVLLVDDSVELATLRGAGVRLPGHKAWSRGNWLAVAGGLAVTLGLGIAAVNALPRMLANAMPIAWERQLGEPAEVLIAGGKPHCTGEAGQAALDGLVARLRAAGGIAMPVTLSVLNDRMVNAFTLPGGHVLVMRGLIAEAADGPVLAGVIAHELGHVAHRDATTLLLRGMGFSYLLHMLGFGDAGGTVAAGASNLMNLAYTRAAEAAADSTAIDLLTAAGMRADGLSRFFARLERRPGAAGDATGDATGDAAGKATGHPAGQPRETTTLDWFDTHPPSEARREWTARPPTGEMPFTDTEWQAIRAMCGVTQPAGE